MNHSVKAMWEEATHCIWPKPGKFTAGEYDTHLENFAKLIVLECAKLANQHDCNNSGNAGEILNHFGLEDKCNG